jgi:hypothetical protein
VQGSAAVVVAAVEVDAAGFEVLQAGQVAVDGGRYQHQHVAGVVFALGQARVFLTLPAAPDIVVDVEQVALDQSAAKLSWKWK